MRGTNLIIVDSDGLIGLINPNDPNHEKCLEISNYLTNNGFSAVVPYPIVLEAATALARDTKINRSDLARKVLTNNAHINEQFNLDEKVANEVSESFQRNASRKNTPFDHYLLAVAKKNDIKYIFSFDSFYKKQGLIPAEELLKKTKILP